MPHHELQVSDRDKVRIAVETTDEVVDVEVQLIAESEIAHRIAAEPTGDGSCRITGT